MSKPNNTKAEYLKGNIDLENDQIRVALIDDTTAYTFDKDSHDHLSDVLDGGTTAQEMSGSGYSRKSLTTKQVTVDDTDDEAVFDADDLTWSNLDAGTIQAVVVYQQVGGDATTPADDVIIGVLDDTDLTKLPLPTNGSDVAITWPAEGIVNLG